MSAAADPEQAPRVVVADDQMLVRSGFRLILSSAGIPVVGEAADGREAVAAALKHRPDVMLMDIRMPEMDGLEATRRILASRSGEDMRVIILTTFDLDQYVYAALAAGASGFLLKDVSPEHLIAAVQLVRSGDALLAPSITRRLVERYAGPQPELAQVSADRSRSSDSWPGVVPRGAKRSTRRRVMDGASRASPVRTSWTAATRCSGDTSLSRKPLAPAASAA